MTEVRDCDLKHSTKMIDRKISDASNFHGEKYLKNILPYAKGSVLHIGCGFGAMLSTLVESSSLDGVEISERDIEKGRECFPFITFWSGDAARIGDVAGIQGRKFDLIICNDVIQCLNDSKQSELIFWINNHLSNEGVAFVSAFFHSDGNFLSDELVELVGTNLNIILNEQSSDSRSLAIMGRKKRRFASISIDYETWHPIPEGKTINWDKDIFEPTEHLFLMFERAAISVTFFVEMGEYFWLLENDPLVAQRMAGQWREAVRRGHDIQLHLHPCWLPEIGARNIDGEWYWDWSKSKAADYPGDLTELIRRCKTEIERHVRMEQPSYEVTCFRAGGYQAQPFDALSNALIVNGIVCDSSVFPYGKNNERDFDYSTPYSTHQPYFADLLDPQLKALPSEEKLLELPIFTPEQGRRWFIDNDDADTFAQRLLDYEGRRLKSLPRRVRRFLKGLRRYVTAAYFLLEKNHAFINRLLPRKLAYVLIARPNPRLYGAHYFVAIGHTKADLRYETLKSEIQRLKTSLNIEFVTISEMARIALKEIEVTRRLDCGAEIDYQVQREMTAILGEKRNEAQSYYLQEMIPFDCVNVLDFGCGAGYWSDRIGKLYPWMRVTGVDAGEEFITKARRLYERKNVKFEIGDFACLEDADCSYDCVYADNTLEHSFDLSATLCEIYRVLRDGGSLVAALPLDGLNPNQVCDNHTWKTVKFQAVQRLARAGFINIEAKEVDTYRMLGMPPYMPSLDRMLYVRAWKNLNESPWVRVESAMRWIYERVEPAKANLSEDAKQIILDGYAYCIGYTVALGQLLKREGYEVTWVTMRAEAHKRGRGLRMTDTHEVLEVSIKGDRHIFDPMSNTHFACSLDELITKPEKADKYAYRDARGDDRSYYLYNTSYWYKRVVAISRRRNIHWPSLVWKKVSK